MFLQEKRSIFGQNVTKMEEMGKKEDFFNFKYDIWHIYSLKTQPQMLFVQF